MNAYRLFKQDGTAVDMWVCGVCNRAYTAELVAAACCVCDVCGEQLEGKPHHYRRHDECHKQACRDRLAKRIAEAEIVETWGGPVFNNVDGRGCENDYYESIEALVESLDDDEIDLPEYVFTCDTRRVVRLDASCILDNIEAWDDVEYDGVTELEEAIKAFNEANAEIVTWVSDYKKIVKVTRPKEEDAKPEA